MSDIKVSVIVPVYNGERFLERCFDCLCRQTLEEIEFIIVNDVSTDNSLKIMHKYKNKYPDKFILLNNKSNKGQGGARNLGIKYARGQYIGFMDQDDVVKSRMFEKLYNKAVVKNSDIVMCPFYNEKQDRVDFIDTYRFEKGFSIESRISLFMYMGYIWHSIFRRDFLDSLDLFFREIFYCEDIEFLCEVYSKAESIDFVNKVMYIYKYNEISQTNTDFNSKTKDFEVLVEDIFKATLKRCQSSKYFNELKEVIYFRLIDISEKLLRIIIKNGELSYESINNLNKLLKKYVGNYSSNKYIKNYDKYFSFIVPSFEMLKYYDVDSKKFYNNIRNLNIISD